MFAIKTLAGYVATSIQQFGTLDADYVRDDKISLRTT